MDDLYQNDTAPSGYPEGFDGEIDNASQNVMPTYTPSKSPLNFNFNFKIIGLAAGCVLLLITIIVLMINLFKPKKVDEKGYRAVAETFVEALEKKEPELFDSYVPEGAGMDDYMEKVIKGFEGQEIKDSVCEFDDEKNLANVTITTSREDGIYKTVATIEAKAEKNKWYLYSCKFSDFDLVEKFEDASPTEAVEERTLVNVGTDVSGYFDVPNDFALDSLILTSSENIAYDYTLSGMYQDRTESVSVIVYLESQPLSDLATKLSQNLFGETGEIVPEIDKGGDVYREVRNVDGLITETRTFLGSDGRARSFVLRYVEGDEFVKGLWNSYTIPAGIVVEPTPTDATQVIGSETMGTLEIPGYFTLDEDYMGKGIECSGYSSDEKTVVIMNYAGTDKESVPVYEFAETVRESLFGDAGSELKVRKGFPQAYYSSGIGEDEIMSEIYAFRGNDDINRLILLIHNKDDKKTAKLYKTYNLEVGIKELE